MRELLILESWNPRAYGCLRPRCPRSVPVLSELFLCQWLRRHAHTHLGFLLPFVLMAVHL